MQRKKVVILGSTGSIGRQALSVIREMEDTIEVVGLAAGTNWELLAGQVKEFYPRVVSVSSLEVSKKLKEIIPLEYNVEVFYGLDGLCQVAALPEANLVLNAVTGVLGLQPTITAINAGKDIALANKETMVAAGFLVMGLAKNKGVSIIPVDSEHSAIWQCLQGEKSKLAKLILTASGGPFRTFPIDKLATITAEMALNHPNWQMGPKVTVDSATLMNKGLEIIEARWLFDVDYPWIEVIVHQQSIIHSMVEFVDGSVLAQLAVPDMRLPIQYALTYPERKENCLPRLDFSVIKELTFEVADIGRFPCLSLARHAGETGGTMPAVLNAANEVAVAAFLKGEVGFSGIPQLVETVMNKHKVLPGRELEEILAADRWARQEALLHI